MSKRKYEGPEVEPANTSDTYIWVRPPGMPDWQRGILLLKVDIPELIRRLQKHVPKPQRKLCAWCDRPAVNRTSYKSGFAPHCNRTSCNANRPKRKRKAKQRKHMDGCLCPDCNPLGTRKSNRRKD